MSKSGEELHAFIQTLSPQEKRYFKRFASRHGDQGDQKYLRLFEVIAAQEVYDEAAVKGSFEGEAYSRNLAFPKHHLFQLILRSLQQYHYSRNVSHQIRNLLGEVELLYERGFYAAGLKKLQKARGIVERYDSIEWLPLLRSWERLLTRASGADLKAALQTLHASDLAMQSRLERYFLLLHVMDEIRVLLNQNFTGAEAEFESKLAEFERLAILQEAVPEPFRDRTAFLSVRSFYALLRNNKPGSVEALGELVATWGAHPHQINNNPNRYAKAVTSYLTSLYLAGEDEVFLQILKAIRSQDALSLEASQYLHFITHNLELVFCLNRGQFEAAQALVPILESSLQSNKGQIDEVSELALLYNLMAVCFVMEDFSAALHWTNRILNRKRTSARMDIQHFTAFFQLVLHYELGHGDLVEYLLQRLGRKLRTQGVTADFDRLIVGLFRELVGLPSGGDFRLVLESVLDDLNQLEASGEFLPFGFSELQAWLSARAQGRPIREML